MQTYIVVFVLAKINFPFKYKINPLNVTLVKTCCLYSCSVRKIEINQWTKANNWHTPEDMYTNIIGAQQTLSSKHYM
jgi:hypothetical protein